MSLDEKPPLPPRSPPRSSFSIAKSLGSTTFAAEQSPAIARPMATATTRELAVGMQTETIQVVPAVEGTSHPSTSSRGATTTTSADCGTSAQNMAKEILPNRENSKDFHFGRLPGPWRAKKRSNSNRNMDPFSSTFLTSAPSEEPSASKSTFKSENTTTMRRRERRRRKRTTPLLASFTICLIFLCAGFGILYLFVRAQQDTLQQEALELATDLGGWFQDQIDKAVLPLYSLAQFASKLDVFNDLPNQIGPAFGPNSLPFLPPERTADGEIVTSSYRNVTGVCDDPKLTSRFDEIANALISSARLPGILVNLQLAPMGVVCLLHPLVVDTENLDGKATYMNNTSMRGMDLFADPKSSGAAALSIARDQLATSDPLSLRQCQNPDDPCRPANAKALIARLPVLIHEHAGFYDGASDTGDHALLHWNDEEPTLHSPLVIHGVSYPHSYGFATALLNWDQLLEQSRIHDTFSSQDMKFQLSTTKNAVQKGNYINPELEQDMTEVIHLAGTPNLSLENEKNRGHGIVRTTWDVTDQEWEIVIVYPLNRKGEYRVAGHIGQLVVGILIVLFSLAMAFLSYTILFQREVHHQMLTNQYAQTAKLETERNMTAYFAHELRNPLAAVDCALDAMPGADDDDEEFNAEDAKELLSAMKVSVGFMSTIMNNLLDVRKMEEGQLQFRNHPLSLCELVCSVRQMLAPSIKRDVEFRVNCLTTPGENDWVLGDAHRIQQVIVNVTTNAIKYTTMGSIVISVGWESINSSSITRLSRKLWNLPHDQTDAANSIKNKTKLKNLSKSTRNMVTSTGKDSWVKIAVTDTGPGIPKKDQDKLFERFVQRGGAPGTGLGLAISKQIVDMMGGTIRFVSDPSVKPGTTCLIKLPMDLWEEQPTSTSDDGEDESSDENEVSSVTGFRNGVHGPVKGSVNDSTPILHGPVPTDGAPETSQQGLFQALPPPEFSAAGHAVPAVVIKKPKLGGCLRINTPALSGNSIASNDNKSHKSNKSKSSNSVGHSGGSISSIDKKDRHSRDIKSRSGNDGEDVILPIERPFKLLLVDDIQMNRSMLKRRFAKKVAPHAFVTEASTGEEALNLIREEMQKISDGGAGVTHIPYDVIIVDHYMEQAGGIMVGTDAVIAMRRIGLRSFIIGCSGNDMEQQFLDAGADVVWKKPMPSNPVMIQQIITGLDRMYSGNN